MSGKQDIYQYLFGQISTDELRKKIQNQVLTYILKNYPIHNEKDNIIYNLIQISTEIMGVKFVDLKTERILDLLKIILDQKSVIITRKPDKTIGVIGNKLSPNSFYQILPMNGNSDMYPMSFSLMQNRSTSVVLGGQSMETRTVFGDLNTDQLNKIALAYVKGDILSGVNPLNSQDRQLLTQVKQDNLAYRETIECKLFLPLLETQFDKPCQMFKKQTRGITSQPFFFSIAVMLLRMAIDSLKEISIDLFNPAQAVDLIYQILSSPSDLFKTYINGNICENKYKLLHKLFTIINEYSPDINIYMYIQTMNDTFQKCKKEIEQRKQNEHENFDFECHVSRFTVILIQYFVSKNLKFQSDVKANAFPVFIFDKDLCRFIQEGAKNDEQSLGEIQDYYHTNDIIDKFYAQDPIDLQQHMYKMARAILDYDCSYIVPDTIEKYNEDVQTPQDYILYEDKHNVNLRKIMKFVYGSADLIVNNRNQYFECIKNYNEVQKYEVKGVFTLKLNLKIEDNIKDLQGDQKIMDVNRENTDVGQAVSFRQIGVLFNQTLESFNVIMQINGQLNYDKNLNLKEKIFYGKMFQYSDCKTPNLTLFLTDQGIKTDESIEDLLNRNASEECELKTQLLLKEIHGDESSFFPFKPDPLQIIYSKAKNKYNEKVKNDDTLQQINGIRQSNKSIKNKLKLMEIVQKFKLSTFLTQTTFSNNTFFQLGLGDDSQQQNEMIYQKLYDEIQQCINQINKPDPSKTVFSMKLSTFNFIYLTTTKPGQDLVQKINDIENSNHDKIEKGVFNFLVPVQELKNMGEGIQLDSVDKINDGIRLIIQSVGNPNISVFTQNKTKNFITLINKLIQQYGKFKNNTDEISILQQQIQNEDVQIESINNNRQLLLKQLQLEMDKAKSKLKKSTQNIDSSKYYIDLRVINQAQVPKKLIEVDVNNQIIELNRLNYKINLQLLSQLYPGSQPNDPARENEIKQMIQKENEQAVKNLKKNYVNATSYDEFIDCLVRYKVLRKFENTIGEMSTVEKVQREFFKTSESLKSNVKNTIFGLDTGAGKTDVMIMKLIQDLCAEPRCIYYVTLGTLIEKQYYDINKFILIREIKNRRCMRLQTQKQVDNHIGDENTLFLVDQKQFFMLMYYNKIYPKSMIICDEIQTFFSSDGYQLQINEQDPSGKNTYQDKLFNFIKNAMKYMDSKLAQKAQGQVIQSGLGNIPILQIKQKLTQNKGQVPVLNNQSHNVIPSQLTSNYQQFLDEVEINHQFSSKMKRIIDQKEVNKNYGHKFYGVFSDMCIMSDSIKNFMAFPYKGSNNVQCDQSFTQLYTQIMLMVKMLSYDLSDKNGGEQFFQDLMPFITDIISVFKKFNDNKNVEIWKILLKFIKYSSSQKVLTIYDILQYIVNSDSRLIGFTATPVLDVELDEVCNIIDEKKKLNLDFYIQTSTGMQPYLTGQEETSKQKNDYFMDFQTKQFSDIQKYIRIAVDKKNINWAEVKQKLTEVYINYSSRSIGFCDLGQFFTTKNEETCKLIRDKLGLPGHEIQYFDDVKSLDKAPVSKNKFVSYFSSSQYVGVNPGTDKDIGVMILTGDIYNLTIDQFYQTIGRARRQYNSKEKEFVLMFLQEKSDVQNKNIQTQKMNEDIELTVKFTRKQKQDVVQRSYKYLSAFKMKRVFDFQRDKQPFQNEFVRKQYNPIIDHNIQNTIVKVVDINLHKELVKFYNSYKNIGTPMKEFVEKQFQLKANNNYNDVQLQVTRDNELISKITTKSIIKYNEKIIPDFDITFSNEIDIDQMKNYIHQIKNGKYDQQLLDYLSVCEQFPINNMNRTDTYEKCGQLMADVQKRDDVNVVINNKLNIIYSKQYQIAIYMEPEKKGTGDENHLEKYLLEQLKQIHKGQGQSQTLSTQDQSKQFLETKNKYENKLQTLQIIRYYLKMTEELKDYIYATNLQIVRVLFNDSQPDQRDQLMREIVISNFNFNYAQDGIFDDTKQVQFLVFMYQLDKLGVNANEGSIELIEQMIQMGKVNNIGDLFAKSKVTRGDIQLSNIFWNFVKNYGAYIDEEKIQFAVKRVQHFIEEYQDHNRQIFQLIGDKFGMPEYIGGEPDTVESQIANVFKDDDDKIQQEINKYQDLIYKLFLSSNLAQISQQKLIQYFMKFLESGVLKYDELIKYNQGGVLEQTGGQLIEYILSQSNSEKLLNKLFENGFQDMVIEYINGNNITTSNPVILYLKRILPKRKMIKGAHDYNDFFLDGDKTINFNQFIQQRLKQAKFCPKAISSLPVQQDITEILNMAFLCPNDQQMFDFAVLMSDTHMQNYLQIVKTAAANAMIINQNGYAEWYEKEYKQAIQNTDYPGSQQSFKEYIQAYIGAQRKKEVKIEDVVELMNEYYSQDNTSVTLKMIQQNMQGLKEYKVDEFLNSFLLKQSVVIDLKGKMTEDKEKINDLQIQLSQKDGIIAQQLKTINGVQKIIEQIIAIINQQQIQNDNFIKLIEKNLHILQLLFDKIMDKLLLVDKNEDDKKKLDQAELSVFKGKLKKIVNGFEKYWSQDNLKQINKFLQLFKQNVTSKMIQIQYTDESDRFEDIKKVMDQLKDQMKLMKTQQIIEETDDTDKDPLVENFNSLIQQQSEISIKINIMQELLAAYDPKYNESLSDVISRINDCKEKIQSVMEQYLELLNHIIVQQNAKNLMQVEFTDLYQIMNQIELIETDIVNMKQPEKTGDPLGNNIDSQQFLNKIQHLQDQLSDMEQKKNIAVMDANNMIKIKQQYNQLMEQQENEKIEKKSLQEKVESLMKIQQYANQNANPQDQQSNLNKIAQLQFQLDQLQLEKSKIKNIHEIYDRREKDCRKRRDDIIQEYDKKLGGQIEQDISKLVGKLDQNGHADTLCDRFLNKFRNQDDFDEVVKNNGLNEFLIDILILKKHQGLTSETGEQFGVVHDLSMLDLHKKKIVITDDFKARIHVYVMKNCLKVQSDQKEYDEIKQKIMQDLTAQLNYVVDQILADSNENTDDKIKQIKVFLAQDNKISDIIGAQSFIESFLSESFNVYVQEVDQWDQVTIFQKYGDNLFEDFIKQGLNVDKIEENAQRSSQIIDKFIEIYRQTSNQSKFQQKFMQYILIEKFEDAETILYQAMQNKSVDEKEEKLYKKLLEISKQNDLQQDMIIQKVEQQKEGVEQFRDKIQERYRGEFDLLIKKYVDKIDTLTKERDILQQELDDLKSRISDTNYNVNGNDDNENYNKKYNDLLQIFAAIV